MHPLGALPRRLGAFAWGGLCVHRERERERDMSDGFLFLFLYHEREMSDRLPFFNGGASNNIACVPACEVFSKIFLLRRNFAKFMFVSARPIKRERERDMSLLASS